MGRLNIAAWSVIAAAASHAFLLLPLVTGRVAMAGPFPDKFLNKLEMVKEDPIHPQTLVYLGMVDGKSYFVETEQSMNWTSAKAFCEASNLKLASIETQKQVDLLNNTLRQYPVPRFYWTSLHESRRPSMMEWDGTNLAPDETVLKYFRWDTPAFQYCSLFYIQPPPANFLIVADWHRCGSDQRPLCQS